MMLWKSNKNNKKGYSQYQRHHLASKTATGFFFFKIGCIITKKKLINDEWDPCVINKSSDEYLPGIANTWWLINEQLNNKKKSRQASTHWFLDYPVE